MARNDQMVAPGFGAVDCNENGVPDECDIASQYSADANSNHVPDECEWQGNSMQGGGGEGPCAALTDEECRRVFWDWAVAQCWGRECELTGFEQYQALVAKLNELGLSMVYLVP